MSIAAVRVGRTAGFHCPASIRGRSVHLPGGTPPGSGIIPPRAQGRARPGGCECRVGREKEIVSNAKVVRRYPHWEVGKCAAGWYRPCNRHRASSVGGCMNHILRIISLWFVSLVLTSPAVVMAGKCSGTNVNNLVSWDQTEIGKGTTHATLRVTSVTVSDDPSVPYHLIAGECIGSCMMTPDGKTKCVGTCARADKDGDVLNEEWVTTSDSGDKGTWRNTGGTGKYARAANTAQFEVRQLGGKMAISRWVGNCQ